MSIQIPVRDSDEVVEVKISELPEEVDDVIGVLQAELAPLDIWIQFAIEYYKQNNEQNFEEIMNEANKIPQATIDEKYADQLDSRIRCLNILAGHYIEKSKMLKSSEKEMERDSFNTKATTLLNQAESIYHSHPSTFISRGVMYLQKSEFDRAETQFDTALVNDPKNIPAMLGRACVLYSRKEYNKSLELYKDVLKTLGSKKCPASVRLGLGLCHYQLGHVDKALACFNRVLQLSPSNVGAHIAIAIIELNRAVKLGEDVGAATEHIKKAVTSVHTAYQLDPNNSMALNHLSNHCFYRGDHEKVNKMSMSALHNTPMNEMKAESYYNLARVQHVQQSYQTAFSYYFRSSQLNKQYAPGLFGCGQLYLQKGDVDNAISSFRKVIEQDKDNYEANKILGSLYAQTKPNKPELALKHLRIAHAAFPKDEEVLIEIGQSERRDFQASLDAFLQAEVLIDKKIQNGQLEASAVPYQFYNNVACVSLKLGHVVKATHYLLKALQQVDMDESTIHDLLESKSPIHPEHATLVYNFSRILEEMKQTEKAKSLYVALAKQHPNYIECYLRLGIIHNEQGDLEKAIMWCNVASKIRPSDPTSLAIMGDIYLKHSHWSLAQKKFDQVLKLSNNDKKDIYALLAMGNMFIGGIRPDMMDPDKTDRHLQYASAQFERVLQIDKNNIYAALGLGAVLAERGYTNEAKDIFTKVRENHAIDNDSKLSAIPETWINLGHLNMVNRQYTNAAKLYENCLKKFYNFANVDVLMFLAKAEFESNKFDECEKILEKAIRLEPNRLVLWFNLAVTSHEHCLMILKDPKKNVTNSEKANRLLEASVRLFTFVSKASKADQKKEKAGTEKSFIVRMAKNYIQKVIQQTRNKANEHMESSKLEQEKTNRLKQQQLAAIEQRRELEDKMLAELEQKKKAEEEARKQRFQEQQDKLAALQEQWNDGKPDHQGSAAAAADQEQEYVDEDQAGGSTAAEKKKRKKKEKGEKTEKKKKRVKRDDSKKKRKQAEKKRAREAEDEEEAETPVDSGATSKKKRLKKKTSDEDEDDAGSDQNENPYESVRDDGVVVDAADGEEEVMFEDVNETTSKEEQSDESVKEQMVLDEE
ncbi:RNA polymerase-associated protein CTR9 [Acrasis kona]|uniref:RNA polymerase-associated protein CTR9 n=1 Tax=Acrasis kona TaxID=1008807 RepID=A0AAW2Z4R0_9EUKA